MSLSFARAITRRYAHRLFECEGGAAKIDVFVMKTGLDLCVHCSCYLRKRAAMMITSPHFHYYFLFILIPSNFALTTQHLVKYISCFSYFLLLLNRGHGRFQGADVDGVRLSALSLQAHLQPKHIELRQAPLRAVLAGRSWELRGGVGLRSCDVHARPRAPAAGLAFFEQWNECFV